MSSGNELPPYNPLGHYAGFVTRLVSFLVDQAILGTTTALSLLFVQYILTTFEINEILGFAGFAWQVATGVSAGTYAVFSLVYNIGFWLLAGQTLGKRLLGVRIVRTDGQRLRFGNAVLRQVGYVLSAILFLGYLWILFDNKRQGLHDKIAGTIVVYSWPEEELQGTYMLEQVHRLRQRRQQAQEQ